VEDPRTIIYSETERRKNDIDQIDPSHPLLPIALNCLQYSEVERPSADELCKRLASLKREPRYTKSEKTRRHTRIKEEEIDMKHAELERERLAQKVEELAKEVEELKEHIQKQQEDIEANKAQLEQLATR
jgi:peptidoglycan hydrolase CwlO-like protein